METIYARVQLSGSGRSHIHGYKRTPPTFVDGSLAFASSTDSSITVGGVRAYSRESSFDILAAAFPAGDGTAAAATFADVQAEPSAAYVTSVTGITNFSEANAASAHDLVLSGLIPDTQYDIVFFARDVLGLVTEIGAAVLQGAGIKTATDHTPPVNVQVAVGTGAELAISEVTGSTITIQTKGYDVGSTFQAHVAAFQADTLPAGSSENVSLADVKAHETYKASAVIMDITSLSAAQASAPISVVVDMGLKELTAYKVIVFLEDALGNASNRLVSSGLATTLDETPPAVVAFAVDAAATTDTSISACIKAYDAGSTFSVYAKAFPAGVSAADSDTVEKLGGAGAALVAAGVTNASETDATTNPIDILLTDLTASTAYDIVVLMVDTATPVPNILRYQYTQSVTTAAPPVSRSVYFDNVPTGSNSQNLVYENSGVNDKKFTLSMWVNTPIVIGRGPFFTLGPEGTYGPNGRPLVSDGELLMYRGLSSAGAGGNVFDLNAPDIRDGEWHHVCMIIDENITNKVMFYVDGVRFDNNDAIPGGGATLGPLESTNIYFAPFLELNNNEFSLSHAAIFNNRILTDEDVLQIYNNGEPADLTGQSNLWGWWIFDGDFDDYSGNNRHLTKNGPVVFSENSPTTDYAYFNPSRVIQFNNNEPNYSSYGDLSGDENKDIWQLGFNFTVSAWFRTTDEDEDFMIVSWGNCGTNGTGGGDTRQLHINGSGNYKFEVCGGGTPNIDGNFDDNQWHHIVATVNENGTMIKSYLDGGNAITQSSAKTLKDIGTGNHNNLRVGMAHYGLGHMMQGQVSNISIYDRVLTDEECNELWGNGKVTNISTLASYGSIKAWWQFDGNMKDSSPHNRHLTEVGTSDYQTIGSDIYV